MAIAKQVFNMEDFRRDLDELSETLLTVFEGSVGSAATGSLFGSLAMETGQVCNTLITVLEMSPVPLEQCVADDVHESLKASVGMSNYWVDISMRLGAPSAEEPSEIDTVRMENFRKDRDALGDTVVTMVAGSDGSESAARLTDVMGAVMEKVGERLRLVLGACGDREPSEACDIEQSIVIASDIADCFHRMAERLRS